MCRRLPNGTYRYCPSKQGRGALLRGSKTFTLAPDGTLQHTQPVTPATALDGIVRAAHTQAPIAADTIQSMAQFATEPLSAHDKWRMWNDIAAGQSISASLTAMKESGHLQQFPELAALDGVPQDPHWHPEGDVLTHVGLAGDHMARQCNNANINGEDRTLLVLAATLHDLGKATHTQIDENGKITSYGHDDAGKAPLRRFLNAMDAPQRFHDEIKPLIVEHMCAATAQKAPSPRVVHRLQRRLAPATIEQWARVVDADHGGRGTASVDGYAHQWLDVAQRSPARSLSEQPSPVVTGADLIAAGLRPGPRFRSILSAAQEAQADGTIRDEATAKNWLLRHLDHL